MTEEKRMKEDWQKKRLRLSGRLLTANMANSVHNVNCNRNEHMRIQATTFSYVRA